MSKVKPKCEIRDGIVFFEKPYKVRSGNWLGEHLDCDSLYFRDANSRELNIVCYASEEKYNEALSELRDIIYPELKLLRGVGKEEVDCID